MNSALLAAAESDVCFGLDLGEGRVECLWVGVVKRARLSIVLTSDHYDGLNVAMFHDSIALILGIVQTQTGHISDRLLSCLFSLLSCLDREVVLAFVARVVTPIGTLSLSCGLLVCLALARERVLPCDSSAQVVPVDVTVDGDEAEGAPEDPTHLADHPSVRLAHVVLDVEHHPFFCF